MKKTITLVQVLLALSIGTVLSINLAPGQPVPHADILHKMLRRKLKNFTDIPEGSLFNYILGKGTNNSYNKENLDIGVLDVDHVKKIVSIARKMHDDEQKDLRKANPPRSPMLFEDFRVQMPTRKRELALKLMKQSIYAARYRLADTAKIRNHYKTNYQYHIALLYGSLNQIMLKMDNLYIKMIKMYGEKFFWYLILYEKLLAANVDITNIVKRIFALHFKELPADGKPILPVPFENGTLGPNSLTSPRRL